MAPDRLSPLSRLRIKVGPLPGCIAKPSRRGFRICDIGAVADGRSPSSSAADLRTAGAQNDTVNIFNSFVDAASVKTYRGDETITVNGLSGSVVMSLSIDTGRIGYGTDNNTVTLSKVASVVASVCMGPSDATAAIDNTLTIWGGIFGALAVVDGSGVSNVTVNGWLCVYLGRGNDQFESVNVTANRAIIDGGFGTNQWTTGGLTALLWIAATAQILPVLRSDPDRRRALCRGQGTPQPSVAPE